jgi:hypothetical protein
VVTKYFDGGQPEQWNIFAFRASYNEHWDLGDLSGYSDGVDGRGSNPGGIQEAVTPGVKRLGSETDLSYPSSAEMKTSGAVPSLSPYVFM